MNRSSCCIGLTGNIGAGKSHIARMLRRLGFPVYDSDTRARQLLESDAELRAAVAAAFGSDVYDDRNELKRSLLAQRAFPTAESTARLNALVHPVVARDFMHWCSIHQAAAQPLVFKEAALIFEAQTQHTLDAVWLVAAPIDLRRRRIQARDGLSWDQIDDRMARQWPEEWKRQQVDAVIENDGETPLAPQLRLAFARLKSKTANADPATE